MGRRFNILLVLGVALVVGLSVRMALADADANADGTAAAAPAPEPAPTPPPTEALPLPEEVPPPSDVPAGTALPAPAEGAADGAGGLPPLTDSARAPAGSSPAAAPAEGSMPDQGLVFPPAAAAKPSRAKGGAPEGGAKPQSGEPVAPGVPGSLPEAAVDADVERSQAPPVGNPKGPGGEVNPLPEAKLPPGKATSVAPNEADELVLSPERLSKGIQSIGLTIEVKGPPTLNLNTPATYKLIVANPGTTDAVGVVVRDALPPEFEFVSSQPAEQRVLDSLLVWHLGTVRAGGRQEITLKVKPIKVGLFEHAATVSMRAGAKTSTQVYQPKLKVVQNVTTAKVLKGQTVSSRITVSNTGDGVARNVVIQAKLSPGLRAGGVDSSDQNLFELALGELAPGQHVELEPLVADAVLGGDQWCKVEATSPDVAPGADESKSTEMVKVVEPKLAMTLLGPKQRYTDTIATYVLTVQNPGDAPARNVRVQVTLPIHGRLVRLPSGARFDSNSRRLSWDAFHLDPGEKEKVKLTFEVEMGGNGLYSVTAQAVGEQGLNAKEMTSTDVIAMADVSLQISEERRVVDVDQFTTFSIKLTNKGRKEATKILVWGKHSPEVVIKETLGTEEPARYRQDPVTKKVNGEFAFPQIERLSPGQSIELEVKVQALKTGLASFRAYVTHDDVEQPIEDMEALRVTQALGR